MTQLLLSLFMLLQTNDAAAASLKETTTAISRGATTVERRNAITEKLKSSGITFQLQEFTIDNRTGSNVVATIPGKAGSPVLLLGAHMDRVAVGQGALDNAASCAAILLLLDRFKSTPLQNHTITAVFFDLEEEGLLGSRAYLSGTGGGAAAAKAMNLDVFGYGDTLLVTASKEDGAMFGALKQASIDSMMSLLSLPIAQYPASDHQSMAAAGIETLGVAIVNGVEIATAMTSGTPPRILTLIHTENDSIEHVRGGEMARAAAVLERFVRSLDAPK